MNLFAAASPTVALLFIELGIAVIGLALLARIASRFGFSPIPLYLLAGLAFGQGGFAPLKFGEEFVAVGSEFGVVLLLFMLGLEYTGDKLVNTVRTGYVGGLVDLIMNFTPGFAAGLMLGMKPIPSILLGGVTYVSSSGVIAKVLSELKRMDRPETPLIISTLVLEDLTMAVYLPIAGVLAAGQDLATGIVFVAVALAAVFVAMFITVRYGKRLSNLVSHQSDEVLLFSILGTVLLAAGLAQRLQVSAAVGAFLVGVGISGSIAHRTERLISPLRDFFAAFFFLFFGLQINPYSLPPVLGAAAILAAVTASTKLFSGWWAARRAGLDQAQSRRVGATLIARGEFSIVIAALGASLDPMLGPLAAAYVLILAIVGPIAARVT